MIAKIVYLIALIIAIFLPSCKICASVDENLKTKITIEEAE